MECCYSPLRLLHSDVGDFNNGVCNVMRVTAAEGNSDKGQLDKHVALALILWLQPVKIPMMTMSTASDRELGQ